MPSSTPGPAAEWLSFRCPHCNASLRIKAAYGHMRGRCPECGRRILPQSPAPPTPTPAAGGFPDLLPDLVPIEEEWPEPAQLDTGDEPAQYRVTATPEAWPEPAAPAAPAAEVFGVAANPAAPAPAPRPGDAAPIPYAMLPPAPPPPPVQYLPPDQPPPPGLFRQEPPRRPRPLWDGIWTFPWRDAHLSMWLMLGIDLGLILVVVGLMGMLIRAGGLALLGVPILMPLLAILLLGAGSYAAACLLGVVQDTAAGMDLVPAPKLGIEAMTDFFYLLWLTVCCALPAAAVWVAAPDVPGIGEVSWLVFLGLWGVFFPLILLSSLASGSWWVLLDRRILGGMARKPQTLVLYVPALLLVVPCLWLTSRALLRGSLLLAFGAGFVLSAASLIYARLLGRVGWIVTEGGVPRRRRKRKKPEPEPAFEDRPEGGGEDSGSEDRPRERTGAV